MDDKHGNDSKWDVIKGNAKKAWGELTDDDFKKADGSVDKLYGVLQQKFDATKAAIKSRDDSTVK